MPGLDGISAAARDPAQEPGRPDRPRDGPLRSDPGGAWLRDRRARIRAEAHGGRRTGTGRALGAARRTSRQSGSAPRNERIEHLERLYVCPQHVVVTFLPETELEHITQLAVTLSGQLTRVHFDDIAPAIAEALQRVAAATRVDACQLIEFSESGTVARAHVPTRTASTMTASSDRRRLPRSGSSTRLARGELVAISRPEDFPARRWRRGRSQSDGRLFRPGRAGIGRRPGGLRAGDRQRPGDAAMAAAAGRTPAAHFRDPGRRVAASPPRERAALQRRRDRTAERPARGRQRVSERGDQELSRLRRHRRRERGASTRAGAPGPGRADELERVAARPDRNRQGAVRPGAARTQPAACAPAGAGQLRRASADARRKRAVRP